MKGEMRCFVIGSTGFVRRLRWMESQQVSLHARWEPAASHSPFRKWEIFRRQTTEIMKGRHSAQNGTGKEIKSISFLHVHRPLTLAARLCDTLRTFSFLDDLFARRWCCRRASCLVRTARKYFSRTPFLRRCGIKSVPEKCLPRWKKRQLVLVDWKLLAWKRMRNKTKKHEREIEI